MGRYLKASPALEFNQISLEVAGVNVYNDSSDAGVAQLFRARPCQGRGHGLESRHPHHTDYCLTTAREV